MRLIDKFVHIAIFDYSWLMAQPYSNGRTEKFWIAYCYNNRLNFTPLETHALIGTECWDSEVQVRGTWHTIQTNLLPTCTHRYLFLVLYECNTLKGHYNAIATFLIEMCKRPLLYHDAFSITLHINGSKGNILVVTTSAVTSLKSCRHVLSDSCCPK